MAPDQLSEIRGRINPLFSSMSGTESYERRILVEEIDRLRSALTDCRGCLLDYVNTYGADDNDRAALTMARQVLGGTDV